MNTMQIEVGENGYSVCNIDHSVVGDCVADGIHDLDSALKMAELFSTVSTEESDYPANLVCA